MEKTPLDFTALGFVFKSSLSLFFLSTVVSDGGQTLRWRRLQRGPQRSLPPSLPDCWTHQRAMAPRKRGGGGGGRGGLSFFSCCFNGSDHPEITYKLREDFALQTMEPSLPMPGSDELDSMFSELVVRNHLIHRSA